MEQVNGIFDSHAHYDDCRFSKKRDALIVQMRNNGVSYILNAGCDLKSSQFGVDIGKQYPFFYSSVGIHPGEIDDLPGNYRNTLKQLAQENEKVVAIGEIGLDYHYEPYDKQMQIRRFTEQMELAEELNLPVIIHSRGATADTLDILRKFPNVTGVLHCFSGSAETAEIALQLGYYLGYTGVVTFPNAKKAIRSVEATPMDRLLLETDAPYMAPVPCRGKTCTSDMIAYTAAKIAEIKNLPVQEVIDRARENTLRLFHIGGVV